jgi:hypothetical protein
MTHLAALEKFVAKAVSDTVMLKRTVGGKSQLFAGSSRHPIKPKISVSARQGVISPTTFLLLLP